MQNNWKIKQIEKYKQINISIQSFIKQFTIWILKVLRFKTKYV